MPLVSRTHSGVFCASLKVVISNGVEVKCMVPAVAVAVAVGGSSQ